MQVLKAKKQLVIRMVISFIAGGVVIFAFTRAEVNTNKELTKRILSNSLQSMTASKEIADSCASAYNTATACVLNLNTCNIEEESKKLDEFNYRRGKAEETIDWMSEDMKRIIEEVKAKQ